MATAKKSVSKSQSKGKSAAAQKSVSKTHPPGAGTEQKPPAVVTETNTTQSQGASSPDSNAPESTSGAGAPSAIPPGAAAPASPPAGKSGRGAKAADADLRKQPTNREVADAFKIKESDVLAFRVYDDERKVVVVTIAGQKLTKVF